jgi:cytidine deaminase
LKFRARNPSKAERPIGNDSLKIFQAGERGDTGVSHESALAKPYPDLYFVSNYSSMNFINTIALCFVFLAALSSCEHLKKHSEAIAQTDIPVDTSIYTLLIDSATSARNHAYAPYSKFKCGAAVLTASGKIYSGCNVENASYGMTNCAERTAIFKAVSEGETKIKAVAVVADVPDFDAPCGACRQVIFEFGPDADIIMANLTRKHKIEKIRSLLPYAFGPSGF